MSPSPLVIDPALDLSLERELDLTPAQIWAAWTTPDHLRQFFVPAPWTIVSCELDLRPGGVFRTVMRSPEGEDYPNLGCYLEIVPHRRLVFTDALLPGYRPAPEPFFTAILDLEPAGGKTRYRAVAMHANQETRRKHEEMGFHEGWGTVIDQMVAHIGRANIQS